MDSPGLRRRLGTKDAVVIGLGSMLGAGVFAVFAPAVAVAGRWMLLGLGIAAVVAFCNALSSAQLAAQYPASGGTYIYGRERLGPWWGFLAGWSFVIGKTASCAAMAMTFAAYVAPAPWDRLAAVLAVVVLTAVNSFGITRTVAATRGIVAAVLMVLLFVVVSGVVAGTGGPPLVVGSTQVGWYGVLQSAGLLFFAFAGYARIATLGEEVEDPGRTIPRAITLALSFALLVYAGVAVTLLWVVDVDRIATSTQPLTELVEVAGWGWGTPVVVVGAAAASLGALLSLIAGVGRTSLAMARHRDLPRWLAVVEPRHAVPRHAEFVLAVVVCALVLTVDLRGVIGFSSFGVLLYYLVANIAAFTQDKEHRRYRRAVQVVGAGLGLVLVATLPPVSILGGGLVVAVGVAYRAVRLACTSRTANDGALR